jgi:hypothetical protein
MGQQERLNTRNSAGESIGALSSMHLVDACCIAKAYVNAGVAKGVQVRMTIGVPFELIHFEYLANSMQ